MSSEHAPIPESSTPIADAVRILGCRSCVYFSGTVSEATDVCNQPMLDNSAVKDLADVEKACRLFKLANNTHAI